MAKRIERLLQDGNAVQAQLEELELARQELEEVLGQMRCELARIRALNLIAAGIERETRLRADFRDATRARRRVKH